MARSEDSNPFEVGHRHGSGAPPIPILTVFDWAGILLGAFLLAVVTFFATCSAGFGIVETLEDMRLMRGFIHQQTQILIACVIIPSVVAAAASGVYVYRAQRKKAIRSADRNVEDATSGEEQP